MELGSISIFGGTDQDETDELKAEIEDLREQLNKRKNLEEEVDDLEQRLENKLQDRQKIDSLRENFTSLTSNNQQKLSDLESRIEELQDELQGGKTQPTPTTREHTGSYHTNRPAAVREIQRRLVIGESKESINEDFDCSLDTIRNIERGHTYSDITGWEKGDGHLEALKEARKRRGKTNSRLIAEQAELIYRYLQTGYATQELAEMFDVAQSTVSDIKYGKTWSEVTGWTENDNPFN